MNWHNVQPAVEHYIASQRLSADFLPLVKSWYWPLAKRCADALPATKVLGINGAQGSGKSTLAAVVSLLLEQGAGLKCAVLSIDDFYLPLAQREHLAAHRHPLLRVRGVPGTHDIKLAIQTIVQLTTLASNETLSLPRFNKASDDRYPKSEYTLISGPIDLVILEGWCVGATAQNNDQLLEPVNQLEKTQDQDGRWRGYVNQQLGAAYQQLFSLIDCLLMLKAPSMACVQQWRWLQEEKLIEATAGSGEGLMNRQQVNTFIQYYQRLTTHCLDEIHNRAQLVFHLDTDHQITHATGTLSQLYPYD